jgi:hypothetical protein
VLSIGVAIMTLPLAAGMAVILWRRFNWERLSPTLGFGLLFLAFIILAVDFYILVTWVFLVHPPEITKKLLSSRELHRKKKEFFNNLPK